MFVVDGVAEIVVVVDVVVVVVVVVVSIIIWYQIWQYSYSVKIIVVTLLTCCVVLGSTFVRWGRSDCPASSHLVYPGG